MNWTTGWRTPCLLASASGQALKVGQARILQRGRCDTSCRQTATDTGISRGVGLWSPLVGERGAESLSAQLIQPMFGEYRLYRLDVVSSTRKPCRCPRGEFEASSPALFCPFAMHGSLGLGSIVRMDICDDFFSSADEASAFPKFDEFVIEAVNSDLQKESLML